MQQLLRDVSLTIWRMYSNPDKTVEALNSVENCSIHLANDLKQVLYHYSEIQPCV